MSAPAPTEHDAPLWALVKGTLHKDRTFADNVRRLRWKRRRPRTEPLAQPVTPEVQV